MKKQVKSKTLLFINKISKLKEQQWDKHIVKERKHHAKFTKRLVELKANKWKREEAKDAKHYKATMTSKQLERGVKQRQVFLDNLEKFEVKKKAKHRETVISRLDKYLEKIKLKVKKITDDSMLSKKFIKIRNQLNRKLKKLFNSVTEKVSYPQIDPTRERSVFKKKSVRYEIPGGKYKDIKIFLDHASAAVNEKVNSISGMKKVHTSLTVEMKKWNSETQDYVYSPVHFLSKLITLFDGESLEKYWPEIISKILESFSQFQNMRSGWSIHRIEYYHVFVTANIKPLGGSSFFSLPKKLKNKKCIINIKNYDEFCFKYAVARACNPVKNQGGRVDKILKAQTEKYNFEGLKFPVAVKDIKIFEKNNLVDVAVVGYSDDDNLIYPLKNITNKDPSREKIILLLYNEHYSVVINFSKLVSKQKSKHDGSVFACFNCFNCFTSKKILEEHEKICTQQGLQRVKFPKENSSAYFKAVHKTVDVPFAIYADFECVLKTVEESCGLKTKNVKRHIPCGYGYTIKCFNETLYKQKTVTYTAKEDTEDIGLKFVQSLESELPAINKVMGLEKEICMTAKEIEIYNNAKRCYVCGGGFNKLGQTNWKVKDHCHYTGKYRGASHSKCNLKMKKVEFIPVLFHNLEGYDAHLFVKSLGYSEGEINCIPKTDEKYISFSKKVDNLELRFLDSAKFCNSSLANLVKNLPQDGFKNLESQMGFPNVDLFKRKGVYPYEFMDSLEKMKYPKLPSQKDFYNNFQLTAITEEEYRHAQKVWEAFGCRTMEDYHNLYLKSDVLLLADVMESFRSVCKANYGLDPLHYYTSPGLSWDALLKHSKQKLELISDPDIYLMFEKGIRGGVSVATHRYAKANNKYMKNFNDKEPNSFIQYLDSNNLYGWAMCKALPVSGFKWMDLEKENWESMPCILEVDLEYPEKLHKEHNDLPFAPESVTVNRVSKLIPNLNNKYNYVIHYTALKQCLEYGLVLKKIHRGITFTEKAWMKSYIELNTSLRTKATSDFEKDFFKLMNNSVFGKTMENVRNRVNIKLVTRKDQLEKLVVKQNFKSVNIFSGSLAAVHMEKVNVNLNKPIYTGVSILDISKTHMYNFHYGYIKKKFGKKVQLLYTDTDSLIYHFQTKDFYKDISKDVKTWFDTSAYPKEHSSCIPTGVNKKVIGMFKDECNGKQIAEFVGLRSKLYSILMDSGDEKKTAKGVTRCITEKEITHQYYLDCLRSGASLSKKMLRFQSKHHKISTVETYKVALSSNDDKRVICKNGVSTLALGHP